MEPILLVAVFLFAAFLLVLALVAFFAYRVAARSKEGGVGAGGGCLFASLIGGLGLLGLIGFVVFAGILFARKAMQEHLQHRGNDVEFFEYDDFEAAPVPPEVPVEPAPPEVPEAPEAPKKPSKTGQGALDGAIDRGWAQHPDGDVKQY